MSILKRQRLTHDGQVKVTATSDVTLVSESDDTPDQSADPPPKGQQGRSLFVRSLPASATTESLTALFSQSFPLKHATVVSDPATKQSKGYGFVTFTDVGDAQRAQQALNDSVFEGRKIRVELAEPRQRQARNDDSLQRRGSTIISKFKGGRTRQIERPPKLIVRNLPWTVRSEEQLASLFRSYGKVKHATLPKKGPGLSSGFGFVVLRGRKNAERAIEGVNGQEIDGRTLAVDWAVEKEVWENLQHKEGDLKDVENDVNIGSSSEEDSKAQAEVIRSDPSDDIALPSKDGRQGVGDENDLKCAEAVEESERGGDKERTKEADQGSGAFSERCKPNQNQDGPSTLFVRNLPFEVDDEGLQEYFSTFGPIKYGRVVLDQATERSRGTGFVCFYNQEDADACIRNAPKLEPSIAFQNNPNKNSGHLLAKQSLLEDASSDFSGRFTLGGRVLQISRAVDRTEAKKLTLNNTSLRGAREKDRRRLFLLSEGTIPSNSPLHSKLSTTEIRMREDSNRQRQSLIKSNPALHLSYTRLSVRNLPRSITSKDLKALAREAVVEFAKDVKAGLRKQLSSDETSRGGEEMRESEKARKAKGKGIVKQAKIVFEGREGGKVAEESCAGRSRGYGFIEYSSHRWALMGLRWLNGHVLGPSLNDTNVSLPNHDFKERKKRLIVEFAIENAQVVGRRHEREVKARERSKTVAEMRERGDLPVKKTQFSKDQLMAKTRKGTKRKQVPASSRAEVKLEAKAHGAFKDSGKVPEKVPDKLVKRQQIIGRKRMTRKSRARSGPL